MDDLQSAKSGSDLPPQADEIESDDAEEVDEALSVKIAGFLRACWVRRRMVFGILAAGFLLSLLYALSLPNVYTSTTTLMPSDNSTPYSGV
ncbi:MAG: Wzz/FepE/Etk N-terminal domain-containing protein, partial [Terracidiphilus sp.]